jgi:hypothetical protein
MALGSENQLHTPSGVSSRVEPAAWAEGVQKDSSTRTTAPARTNRGSVRTRASCGPFRAGQDGFNQRPSSGGSGAKAGPRGPVGMCRYNSSVPLNGHSSKTKHSSPSGKTRHPTARRARRSKRPYDRTKQRMAVWQDEAGGGYQGVIRPKTVLPGCRCRMAPRRCP